jgi:hypothetical protein
MGKPPTGKRPVPRVARQHSPTFAGPNSGYAGQRGIKKPTGDRPTKPVAKNTATPPSPNSPMRRPVDTTSMPAPKTKWAKRGGGKPHGGK